MSEFGTTLGRAVPKIMLVGLLGAAGCGEAVRGNVFPDLDCGEKPDNTRTTTYHIAAGEMIQLGHAFGDQHGIESDVSVTVDSGGKITATSNERSDTSSEEAPQIQGLDGNGMQIVSGNESFVIGAQPQGGLFAVTVSGKCVQPK